MKNIIYISLVDWFWIKQRPHHFTEILSKSNRITYFSRRPWKSNPNIVIADRVKSNEINKSIIIKNSTMKIIRKKGIPKETKSYIIKKINLFIFKRYLCKLDRINKYDTIIFTHPNQIKIVSNDFLKDKMVIYDCMDNYKCWPECNKDELIINEKKILSISDIVIVSSSELYKNILGYNKKLKDKLYIINNGVDIENFSKENLKNENEINVFNVNNKKKIGYIGTVSSWFDFQLLKNTALKHKELEFYIIGPIEEGADIGSCKEIENIIFTGSQPYYSIPNILSKIDVAIMPFKKNELIEAVNPVKIYEYLAMGKAVVALKYKETEKFRDLIYTYDSQEEFENALDMAIKSKRNNIDKRIQFAKNNSWQARVDAFNKLINERVGRK
ncbi:glycosyltransferase [Clostridium felsineum]|uniref:glycosyltransferase n=1 Tax=Clostridium felsineum TaxID=36839 RepID=UPI00214D39B8|nr:glycosyltransferase [Clostridium felsineum]MCR3757945.1 glycosyltransferase [Clostridium felsineum]